MSICQISIPCIDKEASEELYATMLKPLNYEISVKTRDAIFFTGRFQFHPELSLRREQPGGLTGAIRITFCASSKARVDKFYILGLTKSNTIQRGITGDYPNAYTASITGPDGNIIEAIYIKSWWSKFIKFPVPITGQVFVGAFYLEALFTVGRFISAAMVLIFEVILIAVVANLAYLRLNSGRLFTNLEDSGLLNIKTKDRCSQSRTPYRKRK